MVTKKKIKQKKQKNPSRSNKNSTKRSKVFVSNQQRRSYLAKQTAGKENQKKKVSGKAGTSKSKYQKPVSRKKVTPPPGTPRGPHPPSPPAKAVLKAVKKLPRYGFVSMNSTGYVFLDLNDDWIFNLEDLMTEYGFEIPPYFWGTEPTGAHITIVPRSYADRFDPKDVDIGKKVKFRVQKAAKFYPKRAWYGTEAGYFIWVKSNELLKIAKELAGHDYVPSYGMFHINVGTRRIKKKKPVKK